MLIGDIGGEVHSLHAPSRRAPSAALVVRRDGAVVLIDLAAADPRQRVVTAWLPTDGRSPAATGCWLTANIPLLLLRDGTLVALDRTRVVRTGLRVLGRAEHPGYTGRDYALGLIGRQAMPSSGVPLAVTVDGRSACWWAFDEGFCPEADAVADWEHGEMQGRRAGPILPWLTPNAFVRATDHGGYAAFRLCARRPPDPLLSAADLGTAPVESGSYRIGCVVPVTAAPVSRSVVALDVLVADGRHLKAYRLRTDRPAELAYSRTVEDGLEVTGADFRGGAGVIGTSSGAGGSIDLVDDRGRPRWRFDLECGVQTVALLTDAAGRLKAVAVDDEGGVYAFGTQPPAAPDEPAGAGEVAREHGPTYETDRSFRTIMLD